MATITVTLPVDCKCGCKEVLSFNSSKEELERYPESIDKASAAKLAKLEALRFHNDKNGVPLVAVDTDLLFFLLKCAKLGAED
jgi:hypothetical protein